VTTPNPYVGPRTFEEKDGHLFFGRDADVESLLALVLSRRLVLFYAPSGAGKSSLIRAKLIPRLRDDEGFEVLPIGRVGATVESATGNIFADNLIRSLEPVDSRPEEWADLTCSEYLASRPRQGDPATTPRALIIDQFEEIVTTHLDRWEEREGFFTELRDAIRNDPLLWVVLVMREDYAPDLDPYTSRLPGRLQARFQMRRMDEKAALEAITKPAAIGGRPFQPGVAQTLVDNLRQIKLDEDRTGLGEFVEPVQLQVVCYQLWQNLQSRPPGDITQQDLETYANVDRALADYYESTLAAVLQEVSCTEADLRNWFAFKLITPEGTRGTVYRGATETAGLPNPIVDKLADRYLLRAEVWAGGTWYELVHDRFVEPIRRSNRGWAARQGPLYEAAREWERTGRPAAMLFSGNHLQQALAATDIQHAQPPIPDFLRASADEEERRTMKEQAERQATEARQLRLIAIGAITLLLIALSAAAWALRSRATANEQRTIAEAALATSDAARAAALVALSAQEQLLLQQLTATHSASSPAGGEVGEGAATATATADVQPSATPSSPSTRAPEALELEAPGVLPPVAPTPEDVQQQLINVQATQAAIIGSLAKEIGRSAGGRPIEVQQFGSGPNVLLLVGGLSAGFSPSSVALADQAIAHFSNNPADIPPGLAIHIVRNANPDSPITPGEPPGRLNANGVDLNRNFDCGWTSAVTFRQQPVNAGAAAFSEPETQALRDYILEVEPRMAIFYGARATNGLVVPGYCNGQDAGSTAPGDVYASAARYDQSLAAQTTTTGGGTDWVVARGIPSFFVLLRNYDRLPDAEWQANLQGIQAAFDYLAGPPRQ
jgi:hypothetical protein